MVFGCELGRVQEEEVQVSLQSETQLEGVVGVSETSVAQQRRPVHAERTT